MSGPIETWSVSDVGNLLNSLDLGHMAPLFKENGVSGKDLLTFGNSEYIDILGCTKIQMYKIRRARIERGAKISVDDSQPAANAGAPPAAAPSSAPNPFDAPNPPYNPGAAASDPFASSAPPAYPAASDPFAPQPAYGAPPPSSSPYGGYPGAAPPPAANYPAYPGAAPASNSYSGYSQPAGYPGAAPMYPGAAPVAAVAAGVAVGAAAASHHDTAKYMQARQMLEVASRELQQADGLLRRAGMTATMGVVGDMGPGHGRFGGPRHERREKMGNAMESAEMNNASRHCQVAAAQISDAKRICPELPGIDMAVVQHLRPGIVFEGGMMMEIMRKRKIEEAHRNVEMMMRQVQQAMSWCAGRMA